MFKSLLVKVYKIIETPMDTHLENIEASLDKATVTNAEARAEAKAQVMAEYKESLKAINQRAQLKKQAIYDAHMLKLDNELAAKHQERTDVVNKLQAAVNTKRTISDNTDFLTNIRLNSF